MSNDSKLLQSKVRLLRKQGRTYTEIQGILGVRISKGTLSYWCRDLFMTLGQRTRIQRIQSLHLERARKLAREAQVKRKQEAVIAIRNRYKNLSQFILKQDAALVTLAVLYAAEGSRSAKRSGLMFGNSDPGIIHLFLGLLRRSYKLDERKFRCTVQCRADQNFKQLQTFWSKVTHIPLYQFYKTRPDPRTKGKPSRNLAYKGVCRIDYLSSHILTELKLIVEILQSSA